MKKALITGITGQDGSYLAELLLEKGYEVHGIVRRASTHKTHERIKYIEDQLHLHAGDLTDGNFLHHLIEKINPDEVYNLAAQSHVGESFKSPVYTAEVDGVGVLKLLEAIRLVNPKIKFYQASTSELFGKVQEVPQKETTPFYPRSPYGVSKLFGYFIVKNYRESYGMFACNGILMNHESSRRGVEFITRKITKGISDIKKGRIDYIEVGNLEAKRDWGHAKDFVRGMWLMLQENEPDDYVLATGETHTVRKWINEAFAAAGDKIEWVGEGVEERAVIKKNGIEKVVVKINPEFYRPAEVDLLIGDATKAKEVLGWTPQISFKELVREMVENDLRED